MATQTQTQTETSQVAPINSVPQSKTALKVVFGAMTLGKEGAEGARVHDIKDCASLLDVLQKYGHNEIDIARVLHALQADKFDLFYLHSPNHTTPYEETLEAVIELYKLASSSGLASAVTLHGRSPRFAVTPPKTSRTVALIPTDSRVRISVDGTRNDANFAAQDVIRPAAKKLGLTTAEAAMRWESHHSLMKREYGDAVITGASGAAQLEENLK